MSEIAVLIVFLVTIIGGLILESFIVQYNMFRRFHGYFLFYLFFPILATLFAVSQRGIVIIYVYAVFAVVGTILEWLAGYTYAKVMGKRLWTYHRYRIGPYTSWQSAPLWGMGAVLFWLLARIITS